MAGEEQKATRQPTTYAVIETPKVDWQKVEERAEASVQEGLKKFRDAIEKLWHEKAQATLKESADRYLEGLSIRVTRDGLEATISGFIPVALESGMERFDMKPGLTKNGAQVIPLAKGGFRTVSPNSPGDSWWHPGIQAAEIGEQVKEEAPAVADRIFKDLLKRVEV
jgi:hypothetical protein